MPRPHKSKPGILAKILTPPLIAAAVKKGLRWAKSGGGPAATGEDLAAKTPRPAARNTRRKGSPTALQALDGSIPSQTEGVAGAESPLQLGPEDWKATLKRTFREIQQDRITLTAAGLAFYWFLSVFPSLVAAIALLDLLSAGPRVVAGLSRIVTMILPGEAADVVIAAISNVQDQPRRTSLVASAAGIGLALWSASSGMAAIQIGLNVAYDVQKERTFFQKRLYALFLVAATALFGGVAAALIVFGRPLGTWMEQNLPVGGLFVQMWTGTRWAVALVLLTLLIALFYYLGPERPNPNWKWITPGGVLAVVGLATASAGFSFYVNSFGKYGQTYGSMAGVVILILWLYLAGLAVLLGAELNAELERQSALRALDGPSETLQNKP